MSELPALTTAEFGQLRDLIYRACGIALKDSKRELVAGRLARRLRHHGVQSFREYLELIDDDELPELINCITTNKTSFFRESHHFELLTRVLVPHWIERARRGGSRSIRIWSAGCSTGEEPYSIAMALHELLPADSWDVRILGTDIDTNVLQTAADAVYPADRLSDLPPEARPYVSRCEGGHQIRADVRRRVELRALNLIAPGWPLHGPFDAIFCRNVVIYFDRPTQERLFARFSELLAPDGRLFIGHSENLTGICDRFVLEEQTMYRLAAAPGRRPLVAGRPPRSCSRRIAVPRLEHLILGDVAASARPARYATVLGSCVAACMFDPVARIGGMNHFLLPQPGPGEVRSARYGDEAMQQLLAKLVTLGADPRRLQAKVFGANAVNPGMPPVGDLNARFVREWCSDHRIPIVVDRLGRPRALELHFLTDRGTALFRDVAGSHPQLETAERELARTQTLTRSPP